MENNSGKHLKKELGVFSGISLVAGMTHRLRYLLSWQLRA